MAIRIPSIKIGLKRDERQTMAFHRAGYRALNPVLIALFIGMLYGHFTSNEPMMFSMALIFFLGINIFGYNIERSGWEEDVREQIAGNRQLRRRALVSILVRGLLAGIVTAAMDYFPEQENPGDALVEGAKFAVFIMGLFWWLDVRKWGRGEVSGRGKESSRGSKVE